MTCTTLIETEIRRRLREEFNTTLPRFDLLAARLAAEGVVERRLDAGERAMLHGLLGRTTSSIRSRLDRP